MASLDTMRYPTELTLFAIPPALFLRKEIESLGAGARLVPFFTGGAFHNK